MTENRWQLFVGIGLLLATILILLSLLFVLDTNIGTNQSLRDRVTWLEEKMVERTKPVIQINRATIYNTEGEIVIETLDKKN